MSGSTATGSLDELEGAVIEGYHLLEELHRGGQGVVYRAMQLGTKRQVALKVLLEGPFAADSTRRRFEREVELAASLRHPNIVTILDSGISHGRYFFAMEYIDGLRLDRYLAKFRPPLRATLQLFATICDAVNFAHQRGVIHRDLKPPNILVDGDGAPHVLDFGLAKGIYTAEADQPTVQVLSTGGELLGTVAYMSPEQTVGSLDVDLRSDVYSLGVVFYEALLGQLPYSIEGPLAEVLTRIAKAEPARPRGLQRRSRFGRLVGDELETILLRALEKDPARRYQTAGDLARDLRLLISGQPIEAKRASGLYMLRKMLKRYRLQAGVAAAALLMMVGFLVILAFLWSAEHEAYQRASDDRLSADRSAIAAQQARDNAVRVGNDLRAALIRQTIQRGDLAFARGDLVSARDFYWEAYDSDPAVGAPTGDHERRHSPSALWALRQYYSQTGDDGASVIEFLQAGPSSLSPDGRLVATCETGSSIAIRRVESSAVAGWLAAPGPVTVLSIDDAGNVCAAGRGWARLWSAGSLVPSVSKELPDSFIPTCAYAVSAGTRLLLVSSKRVQCVEGLEQDATGMLELGGNLAGLASYSAGLDRVAIPTTAGVELISVDRSGQLHAQRMAPPGASARLALLTGDRLVAASSDASFQTRLAADSPHWQGLVTPPVDWSLLDVSPDTQWLAFADHTGQMSVFRGARLERTWRLAASDLLGLRISSDGQAVLTWDSGGTLTRWAAAPRKQEDRVVFDRPPVAWAVAEDASSVLLADDRQRVVLCRAASKRAADDPGRRRSLVEEAETIVPRPPFILPGVGTEHAALAVSARATLAVTCVGGQMKLRDSRTHTSYQVKWDNRRTPVVRNLAVTGDARIIACCAESPVGAQQELTFWQWKPPADSSRHASFHQLLPPARAPATLVGSILRQMAFQPRTHRLLIARSNGDLLWLAAEGSDTPTALPPPWLRLDSPPLALAFDRSGTELAVACEDGIVRVLKTGPASDALGSDAAGALDSAPASNPASPPAAAGWLSDAYARHIRAAQPVRMLAFNQGGDVLMISTADGGVALYEVKTGERVTQLTQPSELRDRERNAAPWEPAEPAAASASGKSTASGDFATWIGSGDDLLLTGAGGVHEHHSQDTDALIDQNRPYAHQRAVARYLADGDYSSAWNLIAGPGVLDPELARDLRQTVLAAALRHPRQNVPASWTETVTADAPAFELARLGQAAYDGQRFELARTWLTQARRQAGGELDTYSALRLAECDYLAGAYEQAAESLAQIIRQPDLDSSIIATTQLQQIAALVMAGNAEAARPLTLEIGRLRRESARVDYTAENFALAIARFMTGQETESPLAAGLELLAAKVPAEFTQDPEHSLKFQDDALFFSGELDRKHGDTAAAIAAYQRCIDFARDDWPSNWARFRIAQLSHGGS